jgi:hypothetical protein
MIYVSIDIGLTHFAFVAVRLIVYGGYLLHLDEILGMNMIDIATFKCDRKTCTLHHDKCVTDYLEHVYVEEPILGTCDKMLIERQPPAGMQGAQELLTKQFREKIVLVAPRSVHKFFKISHFKGPTAADKRKASSIRSATRLLSSFNLNLDQFERKHDVADAICQLHFYINRENDRNLVGKSKYFLPKPPPDKRVRQEEEG